MRYRTANYNVRRSVLFALLHLKQSALALLKVVLKSDDLIPLQRSLIVRIAICGLELCELRLCLLVLRFDDAQAIECICQLIVDGRRVCDEWVSPQQIGAEAKEFGMEVRSWTRKRCRGCGCWSWPRWAHFPPLDDLLNVR